jgi:phosphate transport system substrate-binding protein
VIVLAGCPKPADKTPQGVPANTPDENRAGNLTGKIEIDGSSTVYPITEAVADEFQTANPNVEVTVGVSGTGGGFKRFDIGETAIQDASRPIKDGEDADCQKIRIEYIELPIAFDGLTVVVNPKNDWADHLTVEELKKLWEPDSKVNNWKDVRSGFPDRPIKLYGPGPDSGTFDYFTEAINGKSKESRSDYTASEDDNVLVQGVAGDEGALGYFGLAYFEENKDKLKALPIDGGRGAVAPSEATVKDGTYAPLSRPLFIYVNAAELTRPEVELFVNFYLQHAPELVPTAGYIALPQEAYSAVQTHFGTRKKGSMFMGKGTIGLTIDQVLSAEGGNEPTEGASGEAGAQ